MYLLDGLKKLEYRGYDSAGVSFVSGGSLSTVSADGKIAVVHNGIIENYASLKAKLQQDGVEFKSDTDTEVVAHLVSRFYKGSLKSAVIQAISKLEGAFGFGIVCADEPDVLIGARRGSPTLSSLTAAATKS